MVQHSTAESPDGPVCLACARPVADTARLCSGCADQLAAELAAVPGVLDDLAVTRSKQDNVTQRQARVSGTRERPLGYRPAASDAADLLRMTLAYWARVIAGGCNVPAAELPVDAVELAAWLARHRETIRRDDEAATMLDEMRYAVGNARQVVDRPAERIYAGRCQCGHDLYAREKAHQVACPECAIVYTVSERREWMLGEIREHWATAAEIAAGIGELHGQTINRKTINKWSSRDRLLVRGYSPEGHPMFKIGDVLDLAVANTKRAVPPGATCA